MMTAEEYLEQGKNYLEACEYARAVESCKKAIELDPDPVEAYYNLGIVYHRLGEHARAIESYNKALEFKDYADAYYYKVEHDKSIELYRNAIELKDYADVYNNLGNVYDDMGEYAKAIESYGKAIELNPYYANAYYNRGNSYVNMAKYTRAIKSYKRALELKPDYADAYFNLGVTYNSLGKYAKAVESYNKAIELKPDYADAYFKRGRCYGFLGKYAKAIESYGKGIELKPDDARAYFNRGGICYHLYANNIFLEECEVDVTQIMADWNTYIYLSRNTGKLEDVNKLINFFKPYPQTILAIRDYADVDADRLIFNAFEEARRSVADFEALMQLYENGIPNKRTVLSIKAILYYHLGGAVPSYIIFDELLDDGENVLSPQEYYYYALAAIDIGRDVESILLDAVSEIEKMTDLSAEDYYYLAHLYLLQENAERAVENFELSGDFVFSTIMLAYLSDEDDPYIERVRNIKPAKNVRFPIEIDYSKNNLSQFLQFFHLKECLPAIASFDENVSQALMISEYDKPLWEVFKLPDERARETLKNKLRPILAENILKKMEDELSSDSEKIEQERRERFISEAEYRFNNYSRELQEELDFVAKGRETGKSYEVQLGLAIHGFKVKSPRFYMLLIQYAFCKEWIDLRNVSTLYFYLIYMAKKKKYFGFNPSDLYDGINKIVDPFIGISSFLDPLLPFKLGFIISRTAFETVKNIYATEPYKDWKSPDIYVNFKESLQKYILADKDALTPSDFERKYMCFNLFDMEVTL
jgi:tetratricopeptide (TPR) repeat protein